MKTILIFLTAVVFAAVPARFVEAQAPKASMDSMESMNSMSVADSSVSSSTASLALAVADGDSVWKVRATFTGLDSTGQEGPLSNVTVHFYVRRLFGIMPIRDDDNTATTDDSGHADIQMPKTIPGGANGILTLVARVEDDDATGLVQTRDSGSWGTIVPLVADPFPRALWEPNAPVAMVIVISILFGGVWATYGFVVKQLVTIKKGHHDEA